MLVLFYHISKGIALYGIPILVKNYFQWLFLLMHLYEVTPFFKKMINFNFCNIFIEDVTEGSPYSTCKVTVVNVISLHPSLDYLPLLNIFEGARSVYHVNYSSL